MFMLQNHEQRIESCESTTQVDVNDASAHYAAKENSFNFGYNRGNGNYHGRLITTQKKHILNNNFHEFHVF